jgi:hypothetical protein
VFEISLVVLTGMAAAGSRAISGSRPAAWTLLGMALLWPFVNRTIEGPVLLVVGAGHGLTVSDLLASLAALLAVGVLIGLRRRLTSRTAGPDPSR